MPGAASHPVVWPWVALVVALDGAVALLSGLVPDRVLRRYRGPILGFATGTLLATALGDLLPEALARSGVITLAWILATMIVAILLENLSSRRVHHRDRPLVPSALLGSDALHNLSDGMAIAAAFLITPRLGLVTSAAVILHEVPEEIADYALLRDAGTGKRNALISLALVQLTAGIGAAGVLLASSLVMAAEGPVLAIACGLLVPSLWRVRSMVVVLSALVGVAAALAVS
jgi:zinc and cadmium transporter